MTRKALTVEELYALLRACENAFRLEALQDYAVVDEEDAEERRAFREGRPMPKSEDEGYTIIGEVVAAGKQLRRVHVVDLPLTEYLDMEMEQYRENVAMGEDVRIADRAKHPGLTELTEDFLLFDGDTDQAVAVLFRYTPDGVRLGWDQSDEPDDIARCRSQRDLAWAHAVPLEEFRTSLGTG